VQQGAMRMDFSAGRLGKQWDYLILWQKRAKN